MLLSILSIDFHRFFFFDNGAKIKSFIIPNFFLLRVSGLFEEDFIYHKLFCQSKPITDQVCKDLKVKMRQKCLPRYFFS